MIKDEEVFIPNGIRQIKLGETGSSNSFAWLLEEVAERFGGRFVNHEFDFSNNPEGKLKLEKHLKKLGWKDDIPFKNNCDIGF